MLKHLRLIGERRLNNLHHVQTYFSVINHVSAPVSSCIHHILTLTCTNLNLLDSPSFTLTSLRYCIRCNVSMKDGSDHAVWSQVDKLKAISPLYRRVHVASYLCGSHSHTLIQGLRQRGT